MPLKAYPTLSPNNTFPVPALIVIDLALALPCPFRVPLKFIFLLVVVNSTGEPVVPAATRPLPA